MPCERTIHMTFDDYVEVIVKSVSETGYNAFLPSLCSVEGDKVAMSVLDGDIAEDGDELLAKEWAAEFLKNGKTVFLAFRQGQRTVTILEFLGSEPIRKQELKVNPYAS